jgi:hypothetical protein
MGHKLSSAAMQTVHTEFAALKKSSLKTFTTAQTYFRLMYQIVIWYGIYGTQMNKCYNGTENACKPLRQAPKHRNKG